MVFSEVLFEVSSFERLFAERAVDFRGDAPRRVRSQLGPRSGVMTPLACARLHDARCQLNPQAAGSELHRRAAAVGQLAATNGAAVIGNVVRGLHPLVTAGAHARTANAADVGGVLEDESAVGDRARCRLAKRRDLRAALLVRLAVQRGTFFAPGLVVGKSLLMAMRAENGALGGGGRRQLDCGNEAAESASLV